jgi:ribosome biogenesis GTPase A
VVEDYRKPLVLVMNKIDLVSPELVQRWMDFFRWRYPQLQHVVSFSSHFVMFSEDELKELASYKKIPKRLQKRSVKSLIVFLKPAHSLTDIVLLL